jgi:hypothetical protein
MYPFGNLPDNLIAFCELLRRDHGFCIGVGELHDAARSLEVVALSDERAVRHALRSILSRTRDDAAVFDPAFAEFFFPGPPDEQQAGAPSMRRELEPQATESDERPESGRARPGEADEEEGPEAAGGALEPLAMTEPEDAEPALLARSNYSPLEAEAVGAAPQLTRADSAWRDAARLLVRRLRLGLSRRWRPAARGRRFDLRRTLRASLQTGGEALTARWLRRPRRAPRFVLLVDGSRSMDAYAATALQVAVAIACVTMRVEVFTFSTSLQCVTDDVRRAAAGETRRLERLQYAWGGGTSIGACLRQFLQRFGDRSLSRETVVIVASDGLDVGDPDLLREAMRELHRRSAGVVWLNPLLETPGYEPTAAGMSAARPYITTFTSINDRAGLARLSRLVRLRA